MSKQYAHTVPSDSVSPEVNSKFVTAPGTLGVPGTTTTDAASLTQESPFATTVRV